jgi:RecB family exonuclease
MLHRHGFDSAASGAPGASVNMSDTMRDLLRPEEIGEVNTERPATEVVHAAVAAYRAICGRPDIRALYASGQRWHEVPFTMRIDDAPLRGTIDCLVQTAAGRISVLEFKTGRPRPEHALQLDVYRRAAERLFPGAVIEGHLIYPDVHAEPEVEAPA